MLGLVGFSVAALTFFLYGFTASKFHSKKTTFKIRTYSNAYYLTGFACAIWALSTQVDSNMLEGFVLVGDFFILCASILLLNTLLPKKHTTHYTILAILIAFAALASRFAFSNLSPVVKDGVLIFFTPKIFGAVLILTMLTIWLKSNMIFYEKFIGIRLGNDLLRPTYFSANMLSLLGISGFMLAQKSLTIVVSFLMILFGFFMLAMLNYAVLSRANRGAFHG